MWLFASVGLSPGYADAKQERGRLRKESPSEATNEPAHHRKWFSAARSVPPGSLARSAYNAAALGQRHRSRDTTDRLRGIIDSLPGFRESGTRSLKLLHRKTAMLQRKDFRVFASRSVGWVVRSFVRYLFRIVVVVVDVAISI